MVGPAVCDPCSLCSKICSSAQLSPYDRCFSWVETCQDEHRHRLGCCDAVLSALAVVMQLNVVWRLVELGQAKAHHVRYEGGR